MRRIHHERSEIFFLFSVGAGIVLLCVSAIARFSSVKMTAFGWVMFGLGVATLAMSGGVFRKHWVRLVTSRQAAYGSVVTLEVLFVLGIGVVANVLVARRLDTQWDFTSEKFFTLAEQTRNVIGSLSEPVHAIGFFTSDPNDFRYRDRQQAEALLKLYARASKNRITYEFVDPYQNPQRARAYDVEYESKTVFEQGDRRESTTTVSEADFTSALLRLTTRRSPILYFLSGHDERRTDEYGRTGLSEVVRALEKQNVTVKTVTLRATHPMKIPDDADAVVIAGPRLPYDPEEVAALEVYAKRGGRFLILLDPPTTPLVGLRNWLKTYGVLIGEDLVIDLSAYFQSPENPIGQFESHQITESFRRLNRAVPFMAACSVRKTETVPKDWTIETLVTTSENELATWAETDWVTFPPKKDERDVPGPVSFGLAVKGKGRFVIVGDSDFASNLVAPMGGSDFFVNAVNWLTLQENLIAIPPKDPSDRRLRPMTTRGEFLLLLGVTMFFVPLFFAGIGVGVWLKRR